MYCRNCGSIIDVDAAPCHNCGQNPTEGSNYCPECGHFCIPGDTSCIQCHASLTKTIRISVSNPSITNPQPSTAEETVAHSGPKYLPDDKKYCRNCGLVIPAGAQKCEFCDAVSGGNYCSFCGSGTTTSDTVCSVCATPLTPARNVGYVAAPPPITYNQQQTIPQPVNYQQNFNVTNADKADNRCDWILTLLLCIFLGEFGVHRFYTKSVGLGILQLLTAGGCGLWWLIDIIMICTDSYRDGDGLKLKR